MGCSQSGLLLDSKIIVAVGSVSTAIVVGVEKQWRKKLVVSPCCGVPASATYIDYFCRQKLHEVEHRKIRFAYYTALRISSVTDRSTPLLNGICTSPLVPPPCRPSLMRTFRWKFFFVLPNFPSKRSGESVSIDSWICEHYQLKWRSDIFNVETKLSKIFHLNCNYVMMRCLANVEFKFILSFMRKLVLHWKTWSLVRGSY